MKPRTDAAPCCAHCGASALLMLVQGPDGLYWPAHKSEGLPEVHMCLSADCLKTLEPLATLAPKIDMFLKGRVMASLSLARKSGHVVAGQDDVEACYHAGRGVRNVVVAEDAGKTTARLAQKWAEKLDVFRLLDKDTLGQSLGFGSCSVVGLSGKAVGTKIELKRYAQWQETQGKVTHER